jgi:hypothetical protein
MHASPDGSQPAISRGHEVVAVGHAFEANRCQPLPLVRRGLRQRRIEAGAVDDMDRRAAGRGRLQVDGHGAEARDLGESGVLP